MTLVPVGLELLPEWTPSRNPDLVRFDALVKVGAGQAIEDLGAVHVELLDATGKMLALTAPALDAELGSLEGPAWRVLRARLVKVDDEVAQAQAKLADVSSRRADRRDGRRRLLLVPIRDVVGVSGEPHLWWRYYNTSDEPIQVDKVRASTVLWLDGVPSPLQTAYNGPATLPPGRAISGLWSLTDVPPTATGAHRARLEVLGRTTDEVVVVPHL